MKKYLFYVMLFMSVATAYAQVPIEYHKNDSNLDQIMTSENFVIENFDKNFVTGNMVIWGILESAEHIPMLSIIFDDISSQNRSKNLLIKKDTPITLIFEDNTKLSATATIRKGYGGFDPVCLDVAITKFNYPGEATEISLTRNSRNIEILTSKNIKIIEFSGGSLYVKSDASSDPLLKSAALIKSMFADLRNRYPSNPTLK